MKIIPSRNEGYDEIRKIINCGNVYYCVQKPLSLHLLPKALKTKMRKTIILLVVLYEHEILSLSKNINYSL
jgi:hypothetical protein